MEDSDMCHQQHNLKENIKCKYQKLYPKRVIAMPVTVISNRSM